MGEPGRLPSMGLHRVGHDGSDLAAAAAGRLGEIAIHERDQQTEKTKTEETSLEVTGAID